MRALACALAALWALACAAGADAPDAPPDPLTLDGALRYAWYRHPQMQGLRSRLQAAQSAALVARLWPNPELGVEALDEHGEKRVAGATLAQRLELGGKRHARAVLARDEALLGEAELVTGWCAVRAGVKEGIARLAYATRNDELARRMAELDGAGARLADALWSAGKASEEEALEAQLAAARSRAAQDAAASRLEDARRRLAAALGADAAAYAPACRFPTNLWLAAADGYAALAALARTNSPALGEARLRAAVSEARVRTAEAARWSDVTLGAGASAIDKADGTDTYGVGARLGLELPLRSLQRADLEAARQGAAASRSAVDEAAAAVAAQLSEQLGACAAWGRLRQAFATELLPRQARAAALAQARFAAGKASQLEALREARKAAALEAEAAEAGWLAAAAAIQLERIAGLAALDEPGRALPAP